MFLIIVTTGITHSGCVLFGKKTLRVYLEKNDYSLIWVLWGERENSVEPNLPSRQSRGQPEQVYNSVKFSCYLANGTAHRLGDASETPAWRVSITDINGDPSPLL